MNKTKPGNQPWMNKRYIVFRSLLLSLVTIFLASICHADNADTTKEIVSRISDARLALSQTQNKIETESKRYSESLQRLENDIIKLRDQAANLQRLSDEKILGIDELEKRLNLWNTQSAYQKHLMGSYLSSTGDFNASANANTAQPETAALLPQLLGRTEAKIDPAWQTQEIVSPTGDILQAKTIRLGPIHFALNTDEELAGTLTSTFTSNADFLGHPYNDKQYQALISLQQGKDATLNLDPSLGNAARLQKSRAGIGQHIEQGGFWVVPILIFGALSLLISIAKAIQLYRLPKNDPLFADNISQELAQSKQPGNLLAHLRERWKARGLAQDKLAELTLSHPADETRENLLVAFILDYKHHIERYLGVIAMAAAIAPLLGLLGTVSGMIETFKMMSIFGASDPSTVSGGISEALVTTELGLIVAIPSLLLSALLSRKTRSYIRELDSTAIKLSKLEGGLHV